MSSDKKNHKKENVNVSDFFEDTSQIDNELTPDLSIEALLEDGTQSGPSDDVMPVDDMEASQDAMSVSWESGSSRKPGQEGQKKGKGKKKGKALRIALIIVLALVIAMGAVIGTGITVVNNKADLIKKVEVDREALGIDPRVAEELKNYRNVALLGIDSRDVTDDSNCRSDAMIIASINKTTGDVRLISVFRDTYVNLGDDYGLDKLTHAYFYGGPVQTLQSINRNMDLNCEEVIVVNWKSVADAVDALGGLDIEVKESEINEMNKYIRDTQRNIGGSKKKIKKAGVQTLNGNQAVTYARIRKDSIEGDYRRNERMEIVVEAAFAKAMTMKLSQLNKISNEILPQIKTNMTSSQLTEIVLNLNAYKMGKGDSWPFSTQGWTHNGVWYGPPITLKSNVVELHEKYFDQKDYNPTDTVKTISDSISSITGWW